MMLTDEDLSWADPNSAEVWAPLHAWRALGQLRAAEAIPALLDQLYRVDAYNDDWIGEELPDVFALIGAPAIPGLTNYLADAEQTLFARIAAAHSLANIGERCPDTRELCIASLEGELTRHSRNDPTLNGFLVSYLVDLEAVEALATIREAYQQGSVELVIMGDCEDAEIELGVRKARATPRPQFGWFADQESPVIPNVAQRDKPKIGRNDPCPCGSGKKYKKCCL